MDPFYQDPTVTLYLGDCREVLKALPTASVDSVVTDPPAGIAFMGKEWDTPNVSNYHVYSGSVGIEAPRVGAHKGNMVEHLRARAAFTALIAEVFTEVRRVLKPGGHALVWALPRTSHWTAWALEEAGFEVRDSIHHAFGSGFPKSLNISKALDKAAGVKPVGEKPPSLGMADNPQWNGLNRQLVMPDPQTVDARTWMGWGTALAPAHEVWWLVRAPLAEGTIASNVAEHGTGALNIDACRTISGNETGGTKPSYVPNKKNAVYQAGMGGGAHENINGRWPKNLLLSHAEGCELVGSRRVKGHKGYPDGPGGKSVHWAPGSKRSAEARPDAWAGHADADGLEAVDVWRCVDECPVRAMDEQAGPASVTGLRSKTSRAARVAETTMGPKDHRSTEYPNQSGSVSRFFPVFYVAKPSRGERERGCAALPAQSAAEVTGREPGSAGLEMEGGKANPYAGTSGKGEEEAGRRNIHPTVKSEKLMAYLCRLITPPSGVVLDPFAGSGSTALGAQLGRFKTVLIEQDATYCEIAKARVAVVGSTVKPDPVAPGDRQLSLFGGDT